MDSIYRHEREAVEQCELAKDTSTDEHRLVANPDALEPAVHGHRRYSMLALHLKDTAAGLDIVISQVAMDSEVPGRILD
jgi:hypothetical protein